jgi:hypothetical protein
MHPLRISSRWSLLPLIQRGLSPLGALPFLGPFGALYRFRTWTSILFVAFRNQIRWNLLPHAGVSSPLVGAIVEGRITQRDDLWTILNGTPILHQTMHHFDVVHAEDGSSPLPGYPDSGETDRSPASP